MWEIPDPYPNWGGAMVTAGGLVFYGSLGGDFRAVDRNSGKVLWQRKLGSGIIGNPITYKMKGKQYVSVLLRYRRLDRPAGDRRPRSERQVRRHRCDRHGQGLRAQSDPAGRHALHVQTLL